MSCSICHPVTNGESASLSASLLFHVRTWEIVSGSALIILEKNSSVSEPSLFVWIYIYASDVRRPDTMISHIVPYMNWGHPSLQAHHNDAAWFVDTVFASKATGTKTRRVSFVTLSDDKWRVRLRTCRFVRSIMGHKDDVE